MLADELPGSQVRAAVQAEEINTPYEARSNFNSASTNTTSDLHSNISRFNTENATPSLR